MMRAEILARTPEQLAISPGAGAFFTIFLLGVALILLVLNMSKHLRRVDRHRIEAEMRAEFEAEREAAKVAAEEVSGEGADAAEPNGGADAPGEDAPSEDAAGEDAAADGDEQA